VHDDINSNFGYLSIGTLIIIISKFFSGKKVERKLAVQHGIVGTYLLLFYVSTYVPTYLLSYVPIYQPRRESSKIGTRGKLPHGGSYGQRFFFNT
jgi:hypothetical protein